MNQDRITLLQDKIKHKNFYNGQLCNDPKPVENQSEPLIILLKEYDDREIEFSIVVPVFNQENIIKRNLHSIMRHTVGTMEMIIILDNCVDGTETEVLNLFNTETVDNLVRVIVVRQETPVFETTCDNIGFILSCGKYLLEIQADMEMVEPGYNRSLERGFKNYPDLAAISGRSTHKFWNPTGIGKLGFSINHPLSSDIDKNKLYMFGTCNHSPFLMDRLKAKELGYFDEQNLFLDDSCHDFCARAYYLKGWKNGYIPIEFKAPLADGSIRKPILSEVKDINQKVKLERQKRSNGGFIKTVLSLPQPPIEIRDL